MSEQEGTCLNLFLFSVGGVHFAIDAEQVLGMTLYNGEEDEHLLWFHTELGFGNRTVTYHVPAIVTLRMPGTEPLRMVIDSMEDIAEFSQDEIRLFPALLEPLTLQKGMWGILSRNGHMVLLVDVQRLLRGRTLNTMVTISHA